MASVPQNRKQVKTPMLLTIILALISFIFPHWSIQASPKPRVVFKDRQYTPRTFEAALSLSLEFGYNAVHWEAVNV